MFKQVSRVQMNSASCDSGDRMRVFLYQGLILLVALMGNNTASTAQALNKRQLCEGKVSHDQDGMLTLADVKSTESLWCEAYIGDNSEAPLARKLLQTCPVGSRCRVDGTFSGRGEFYWTRIISAERLDSAADTQVSAVDFIFGPGVIINGRDPTRSLRLEDPFTASALKDRFPNFRIEYSNECDGSCFVVSDVPGQIYVYGDEAKGRISHILSDSANVMDTGGHRHGTPLTKALGSRNGICEAGERFMCRSADKEKGLTYIIKDDEACDFGVTDWHSVSGKSITIPECATIEGFMIGTLPY